MAKENGQTVILNTLQIKQHEPLYFSSDGHDKKSGKYTLNNSERGLTLDTRCQAKTNKVQTRQRKTK
jgi:hypothetical protein